ncbi:MAG: 7TM diverse intracellular signaling domain-containing protein, partial [Myxococcota bacterium]|nr:7TM diverse intracellular signaling domain-containing protein [Myxococcota bacterium]
GATGIFLVLFLTSFLQLPERWPSVMPLVRCLLALCILQAVSTMFASYSFSARFGVLCVVLVMGVALVVGFICLQRGFPAARYFVLAWVFFLFGGIVTALTTIGALPARFITTYAAQIGSAVEITLLSPALGQRFEVIRQEAAAVQRKQVDVERRLNVELETKMHIFSDVSHRLNNPLNFISGGIENLADLIASHRERLWALFPPEGQRDADAQSMIDTFDAEFRQLADYLADVTAGAMRTATFVREMRGLSGVDGANFDPVVLVDVVDRGMERVRDNMGSNLADRLTVNEMRQQLEASSVLGNVYLHAMVLSLAVETLLDHADEDAPLSLTIDLVEAPDEGVEQLKLLVSPGFYGGDSPTMRQALELLTSLLSPYGGRVTMVTDCSAGEGGVLLSLVSEMTLLPRYSKAQGLRPN